jgi:uncharacterized protein YceK
MAELQSQLESQVAATRQAEANAKEAESKAASQATLAAAARAEVSSTGHCRRYCSEQMRLLALLLLVHSLSIGLLRLGAYALRSILPLSAAFVLHTFLLPYVIAFADGCCA